LTVIIGLLRMIMDKTDENGMKWNENEIAGEMKKKRLLLECNCIWYQTWVSCLMVMKAIL